MEAANPQRAVIRLALALGGVMLTVCLVSAAVALLVLRSGKPAPVAQATSASEEVYSVSTPLRDSYQLPTEALTPVTSGPLLAPVRNQPPLYVEPEPAAHPEPTPPTIAEIEAPETVAENGPVTIHNPAAFGPPEDGSLPPLPTEVTSEESLVESEESEPLAPELVASAGKPPVGWEPPTTPIDAPGEPLADLVREEPAETFEPPVVPAPPTVDREALLSYTSSTNDLSRRLTGEVRSGFQLGKSGAVYAARSRFITVLRRIALAKDAAEGASRHADALAAGLRTLDDADDFVPRGDALESELDVPAIAASHGLGLLPDAAVIAPHEAIARYSQHAAQLLAEAAAGEPSGSMALYGLGKSYARLEAQSNDPNAGRKSLVMYRAAVDTHSQNYLAANELGVRLARVGRYDQACDVLRKAAAQPTAIATVHANLAAIEARLGHAGAAVIAQQQSDQLAQQERASGAVSRRHGVQWVSPDAFRRADPHVASYAAPAATAPASPVAYEQPTPQAESPSGWSGFWQGAKQKLGWSSVPQAPAPVATYPSAIPIASQPQRIVR